MKLQRQKSMSPVPKSARGEAASPASESPKPSPGWQPRSARSETKPGVAVSLPPPAPLTLETLPTSPTWAALPPLSQRQVEAVLGSEGRRGMTARAQVKALFEQPDFELQSPADQAAAIRATLAKPPVLPGLATGEVQRAATQGFTMSDPVPAGDVAFPGKPCAALRVDVTVGGKTIPVFAPADGQYSPSAQLSFEDTAKALAALPPESLARVSAVRLSPVKNPEDAFWAQQYGQASFTTFMNCGADGVVTVFPLTHRAAAVSSTLVHETGHAWSMKDWGDKDSRAWEAWKTAGQRDGIPPSQYGSHNLDEDLAETQTLFLESRGTEAYAMYKALYPNRFAILEQRFGGSP